MKILVFLSFVAVAFAVPEEHDCPANSQYEACGTACPLTCDNYKNPHKICILMCNRGCHCDKGYVRVKKDVEECVKPTQCPSSAPDLSVEVSSCDQPRKVGRCFQRLRRYFFNKKSGDCEIFPYSGCAGNDNNFLTLEECVKTCIYGKM